MKVIHNEAGLTFVELIVSVTILGLVIVSLSGLLDSGLTMYTKSDSNLEQLQHLRVAMESLGRDIRRAQSASFDLLQKELTLNISGTTVKYGLQSETIYGPSGLKGKQLWKNKKNQPVASYLDDFAVSIEGNLVRVTLKAKTPAGKMLTLNSAFTYRN